MLMPESPVASEHEASRIRERFERLLAAGVSIFLRHDLDHVLQEVVEDARAGVGGRYRAPPALGPPPAWSRPPRPGNPRAKADPHRRYQSAPPAIWLSAQPPADEILPRRAGEGPGRCVRQPVLDREARRGGVQRRGRSDRRYQSAPPAI